MPIKVWGSASYKNSLQHCKCRQCTKEWESSISYSGKVHFSSAWSSLETGLASTPVTLEGCCRSSLSPECMRFYCFFWSCLLQTHWALTRKLFLTMKQWHFISSGCLRKTEHSHLYLFQGLLQKQKELENTLIPMVAQENFMPPFWEVLSMLWILKTEMHSTLLL